MFVWSRCADDCVALQVHYFGGSAITGGVCLFGCRFQISTVFRRNVALVYNCEKSCGGHNETEHRSSSVYVKKKHDVWRIKSSPFTCQGHSSGPQVSPS